MALMKSIKTDNGVVVLYHRIALISIDVNQQLTILVRSYIDEDGRNYEKKYAVGEIEGEPSFPYTSSSYYNIIYNENDDLFKGNIITQAYEWLKKQPEYKNAIDI